MLCGVLLLSVERLKTPADHGIHHNRWLRITTDLNYAILNDPTNAFQFIDEGKFLGDKSGDYLGISNQPLDRAETVEKMILYGALSAVWQSGLPGEYPSPVVVLSDNVPWDEDGCESFRPEDFEVEGCNGVENCDIVAEEGAFESGRACYDDDQKALWLVGVMKDEKNDCTGSCLGSESCSINCPEESVTFSKLYGIDSLGDFGLSASDAALNAHLGWERNGNANGYSASQFYEDVAADFAYEDLVSADVTKTPGVSHHGSISIVAIELLRMGLKLTCHRRLCRFPSAPFKTSLERSTTTGSTRVRTTIFPARRNP